MAVKVTKAVDFPGEATVTLVGLPNKVTADAKKITKDTTDLVFHIKTDKASPAGNHHEPLLPGRGRRRTASRSSTTSARALLRIDVPLPPKPNAPAPARGRRSPPSRPPATAKPLSRLEKLRLENKQKAKAAKPTRTDGPCHVRHAHHSAEQSGRTEVNRAHGPPIDQDCSS